MLREGQSTYGVMEGGGSYNQYARLPAGGGHLALPFLEQAARNATLELGNQPVVIADYGASQGKNSLAPMRVAIRAVRQRVGPDRPILVFHNDQPENDFNTLFEVLSRDPESYALHDKSVYPSVIGKSFYESVLPPGSVHLGWSSFSAVWLRRAPVAVPGHFVFFRSAGAVRAQFDQQAAEDWELFLSHRADELRPGGHLVVVLPAVADDGVLGLERLFDCANDALAEMVERGALKAEERAQMVLGAYPRQTHQLLAPFASAGEFQGLKVERCELFPLPDAAWTDYQRDGNADALVARHAGFFRAVFTPSLAAALSGADRASTRGAFADQIEAALKLRLAKPPAPLHSFVHAIVLTKST